MTLEELRLLRVGSKVRWLLHLGTVIARQHGGTVLVLWEDGTTEGLSPNWRVNASRERLKDIEVVKGDT